MPHSSSYFYIFIWVYIIYNRISRIFHKAIAWCYVNVHSVHLFLGNPTTTRPRDIFYSPLPSFLSSQLSRSSYCKLTAVSARQNSIKADLNTKTTIYIWVLFSTNAITFSLSKSMACWVNLSPLCVALTRQNSNFMVD